MCARLGLWVLLVAAAVPAMAQTYWSLDLGGAGNEHVADVQVDTDGSIYITGEQGGVITFGGQGHAGAGAIDAFVARLDANGAVQWYVRAGGAGVDRGLKLALGSGNTLAVAGEFMGTADLFGTSMTSAGGTADMYVAVLDKATGALQWVRKGGGPTGTDSPGGVSMAPDGRVTVAGEFRGTAQWEGSTLVSTPDGSGQPSVDVFIATYTASGALAWLKQGAAPATDRAVDVVHDAAGNLYVAGQFSGAITFGQTYSNVLVNASFLLRLDAAGNDVWFRRFGGAVFNHVRDLVMDGPSRVLITGDVQGSMVWSGPPLVTVASSGAQAYYLLAVGSDGSLATHTTMGSDNAVSVRGLACAGGKVTVLGEFECRFTGLATHYGATGLFMATGAGDLFVSVHQATDLALQEAQQYGGRSGKQPGGIGLLPGGDPVFCGSFQEDIIFPAVSGFQAEVSTYSGGIYGNGVLDLCDDPAYGAFAGNLSAGLFDGFIARGHVPGRSPYDWWMRQAGACVKDERAPCIRAMGTALCQDTVVVCGAASLEVDLRFSHVFGAQNHYLGPDVTVQWSTGGTGPSVLVNTSGTYWATVRSENGCWEWTDTVVVVIDPLPPLPLFHDDVVVNAGTPYPGPIQLCDPESHWLWTTGIPDGLNHWWELPLGGGLLYQDSVLIDTAGTFTLNVVGPTGCIRRVQVQVADAPNHPMPDISTTFQFTYPADQDGNDSVRVCAASTLQYSVDPHWVVDGVPMATLPTGLQVLKEYQQWLVPASIGLQQGSITLQGDGWYRTDLTLVVLNGPCGTDTLRFSGTDSIYVEVLSAPSLALSIDGPNSVCSGDTIQLAALCTGCDTVYWNGPFQAVVPPWNAAVWGPGTYTATGHAQDANGCSATQSVSLQVTVTQGPVLAMDPADGILCPGATATIQTTMAGTGHVWYGPLGAITGVGPVLVTEVPGDYLLTMNVGDCPVTSNTVTVEQFGTPHLSFPGVPALCRPGDQVLLTIDAVSNATIIWNAPLSGQGTEQIITMPGTYSCSVSACGITTALEVVVPYAPVQAVPLSSGPFTICPGDTMTLQAAAGADRYYWMPSFQEGPTLVVTTPGDVALVAMNDAGCSDTSAVIGIAPVAFPQPLQVLGDTACAGDLVVLNASGSGTIGWYADSAHTVLLGTGGAFSLVAGADTTLHVRQEQGRCVGNSVTVVVEVTPRPGAIVLAGPDALCVGDAAVLQIAGPDTVEYVWQTPGGPHSGALLSIPAATVADGGIYASAAVYRGCAGPTAEHELVVHAPVELNWPAVDTLCIGGGITFALPIGFSNILWWNGSHGLSHMSIATEEVSVSARDPHGCLVEAAVSVEAIACEEIVPNVFSPNGDGVNDGWAPGGGYVQMLSRIWDRWGGLVQEGDLAERPWNGKHQRSGELCNDGVYFYEVRLSRSDGTSMVQTGYLHLHR